jgi:hypothetical protein
MAIIGAHRIVLAGITAVVLHDHDLRADNLDDLNSVVDELKVVVEVNGDLDCVRKSPEEGEGSKASELLKRIQSEPSDIEALRNLLALATAKKKQWRIDTASCAGAIGWPHRCSALCSRKMSIGRQKVCAHFLLTIASGCLLTVNILPCSRI